MPAKVHGKGNKPADQKKTSGSGRGHSAAGRSSALFIRRPHAHDDAIFYTQEVSTLTDE